MKTLVGRGQRGTQSAVQAGRGSRTNRRRRTRKSFTRVRHSQSTARASMRGVEGLCAAAEGGSMPCSQG